MIKSAPMTATEMPIPFAGGVVAAPVERHGTTGYVPGGAPLGRLARVR